MAAIGFIGLGNMGAPMALNLLKAGHRLDVFDLSESAMAGLADAGARSTESLRDVVRDVDVIISMLPAGKHVEQVYLGEAGLLAELPEQTLVIDCSTIAPETARRVAAEAIQQGIFFLDAPV